MTRKSAFLILVLLTGSLALNAGLFVQARHFYEDRLLTQFWPMGLPSQPQALPAKDANILLFGDSRMVDFGTPILYKERAVNGSANGLTTSQLVLRLPAWLEACHPKIVVMEAGINDLKLLGLRPDLYEIVVSQSLSNFQAMFDQCRQHQAQVILFPVWPPGKISPLRRLVWNPAADRAVTDLNQRLAQGVAGRKDVVWFDPLSLLAAQTPDESRASLYRDDLHLKKEVYSRLVPLLEHALSLSAP